MGTQGLIRLLIVLAVAAVIALIAKYAGSDNGVATVESKTTNKRHKVFTDFPINDIAAVTIQGGETSLNLNKTGGEWVIAERENFPARQERVLDLLRQMWDVKITQQVPNGAAHLDRLELGKTATVLTFKGKDGKDLETISLGKVHVTTGGQRNPYTGGPSTTDAGRYVKTGGSNAVYLVDTPFKEAAQVEPTDWITSDFFKIERIQSISIDTGNLADDWTIERPDLPQPFELAGLKDGEKLDDTKLSMVKSAFMRPSFEDIYIGKEKPKTDAVKWTVTNFDGFTYIISVGEKDDENVRPLTFSVTAKIKETRKPGEEESDEDKKYLDEQFEKMKTERTEKLAQETAVAKGRVFKIRSSTVDTFIKKRSDFLVPPPKPETPGVEIPGVKKPAPAPAPGQ